MKFFFRQKFLLISCIILIGNCLLGYAIYHSTRKLLDSEKWVRHTEDVISQAIGIFSTGKDIKTSSRDFIITNDSSYIKELNVAATDLFIDIKKLRQLTIDNPAQQTRIDSLDLYMHKRYAFALKTIVYRDKLGLEKTIAYTSAQNNQYYSAPISNIINAIRAAEDDLLKQRKENNSRSLVTFNLLSVVVFVLITAFIIILLITTGSYLLQNKEKGKRAAELVLANKELTYQSGEKEKRAAELVIADEELLYQSNEKEKRAGELVIANRELLYENDEKEKRANELVIANKELFYQNKEKEKRAVELAFANEELIFQNEVRKMAENNLLQSESRLKEAQEITHIGNFEVNMENYSETWSDEMYRIFGIVKGDHVPSKDLLLSFVHPDDANDVRDEMDEAVQKLEGSAINFRFIRKDGVLRYGHSEARFDWNSDKELIRIYGIIQDVTDIKLADIERKQMVNDLMIRNNDLEQFAYIISHNLRGPVANIIGASEALNDTDVTAVDKLILKKAIHTSVLKLDDVVKDLNRILQVKSNINETKELVRFSRLVEDIKASIKNLVTRHDVNIKCDFSVFDEFVTIKSYLYSIFYNLISNSVKYCKHDTACRIKIKSQVEKNTLKLIFTDNGLGIDMKKKGDQVFGLYKRFHENVEGKGMGLYMVKTQVETLGGKISIKSKENVGTEFIIEFILHT